MLGLKQNELTWILVLAGIALLAPALPTKLLMILDNLFFRLASILLVLYAISLGPQIGLMTLLVVGLLYLERNRRKISAAAARINAMDNNDGIAPQATVAQESMPQRTVPVQDFNQPEDLSLHFLPGDHMGSDEFHPVGGESLNDKIALDSAPLGEHAASVFEDIGVAPRM
jgi:hypothetical protein